MNRKSKSGLTLTELLLASIVLGIVMLGIVSIDLALRRMGYGVSRSALVTMRTAAIMRHMTNNIRQATGYLGDPGVVPSAPFTPPLWVRRDLNTPQTPVDLSDDTWLCYDLDAGFNVLHCDTPNNSTDCSGGGVTFNQNLGSLRTFIPSVENDASDPTNLIFYVEITLINRFDNNADVHIHNNPDYELISRISPLSFSP